MDRGFRVTMTNESTHALRVPIPRREQIPYPMGRGESPYARRTAESLSDGERRMSPSQDERRVFLSQEVKIRYPKKRGDSLTTCERSRLPCTIHGEERPKLHLSWRLYSNS